MFGINIKNMSKGTIVYIGAFEFPDKNPATHRVVSNAKAIRSLGYETVFVGINKTIAAEYIQENHFGFCVYSQKYPSNVLAWFKYITAFKLYINIIKKQENVKAVICYNSPSISISLLRKWGRRQKVKIIADCTEWYELEKGEKGIKRYIKKLDIYNRMFLVHPKLDGVIVISSYLESFYNKKGTRTIKVPPLTDSDDDKWKKNDINVSNKKNIIYVGAPFSLDTMRQKDRLDYLIDALLIYERQYEFVFHIVGSTREDFLTYYPNFTEKLLGKEEFIKFYGKLSHREAINKLKKCDYSIFVRDNTLTNKAGFPTKFVEAITCGLPVLSNRNSNIEDFLKEGENGFFINNDSIEELIKSLEKPLSISQRELLSMKTQTYNSKLFDFRNYINHFKEILE
ncbi:hypothetical protein LPB03_07070 [Polaribacter vadi]|uniref:Glycosyl transferase family 1 domain-containing protein n=2 Tax=Polaribacter vadi TaxID=1774273 RepID=A0A1B8TYU5_9FLAO|nr:hypothetical protein LPB03_07070 [Polaribacter vadi]OBY64833.1 hypothetical protein LPB3_05420 [Polaribacter vadi]